MTGKRFIVFFALLLSMAGALFAQGFKMDGYFNSGLGVVYSSDADISTSLKAFGADSEQNGFRFRLNGEYSTNAETAGVKFRLQSQSRLDQGGYFSIPYVYGWVNFFNGIVYLAGGLVDDTGWQTADWWINDDTGEGLGVMLKITPLKGLDFGFGAYIMSQQPSGYNNFLNFGGGLPNFKDIMPKIKDAKYTFGASYTLAGIFYLGATFRLKNKAGWNGRYYEIIDIETYGYYYDGRQESSQLIGEFRFLMIEDLTAIIAASIDNIQEFDTAGNTVITQTFAYKLGSLSFGLNTAEFIYNRKNVFGNRIPYMPGLLFNLWGSYEIKGFTPQLDLTYFLGGQSKVGGDKTYMWHRKGYNNYPVYKLNANDNRWRSVIGLRPSLRYNLTPGIFVEIGDMFNYDFANYNGVYADSTDPNKRYCFSNVFYLEFKFSF